MSHAQLSDYMDVILVAYVAERAAADHVSTGGAAHSAREQIAGLLPDGLLTPEHRFLRMVSSSGDESVGGVWFWVDAEREEAFLYNIAVNPQYRRSGFATEALALVEQLARAAGCGTLGLNVFSANEGAIALYPTLGFSAVSSFLNKTSTAPSIQVAPQPDERGDGPFA